MCGYAEQVRNATSHLPGCQGNHLSANLLGIQSSFYNEAVMHHAMEKYSTHPNYEQRSGSIEAFANPVLM